MKNKVVFVIEKYDQKTIAYNLEIPNYREIPTFYYRIWFNGDCPITNPIKGMEQHYTNSLTNFIDILQYDE